MTDDVDRIMAVMASAFDPAYGEAWSRRQVEDSLLAGSSHYLLISPDGAAPAPGRQVAGFTLSRQGHEEEELLLFAIDPAFRRLGLGKQLLARFIKAARSRGAQRLLLEMRSGNEAEALYRKFGFSPIGKRVNYYRTQQGLRIDAITFACQLV